MGRNQWTRRRPKNKRRERLRNNQVVFFKGKLFRIALGKTDKREDKEMAKIPPSHHKKNQNPRSLRAE